MSDDASKFLDEDVQDPTDFPSNAQSLRQLDAALRCNICGELFGAPVTVNCPQGHCFCSLCIRMELTRKAECPLCRHPITEFQLRKNSVVEQAVQAWKEARLLILDLSKARHRQSSASPSVLTPSRKPTPPTPSNKKRKRTPIPIDDDIVEIPDPQKISLSTSSPSEVDNMDSSSASGSLVDCPVCGGQVQITRINAHLDAGCPPPTPAELGGPSGEQSASKGSQKQQWSKFFGPEASNSSSSKTKGKGKASVMDVDEFEDPLPKVAYDTTNARRLREMLAEQGLPTNGDKPILAARHARWITLYNANRDASLLQRKPLKQMKLELKKWEEMEEKKKKNRADASNLDPATYQRDNKATFARLVEAARPKPPERKEFADESADMGSTAENSASKDDGNIVMDED